MRFLPRVSFLAFLISATIYRNTQVRTDPYLGQATLFAPSASQWHTYALSAAEISYKGRWDSKHISWWSAPGVLLAWRIDGQDWEFSNVTANATYHFISAGTTGANLTAAGAYQTFEVHVTNWAYGAQLQTVHVDTSGKLIQLPLHGKTVEIIGDPLSAGQYATYDGISSQNSKTSSRERGVPPPRSGKHCSLHLILSQDLFSPTLDFPPHSINQE